MLKRHLLTMLLSGLAIFPGTEVMAIDAYMLVKGKVVASACTVETGLAGGKTVDLGTFGRTKFKHSGEAGDWVDFTLNLSNCPPGTTKSTVTFTGNPDSDDATLFANSEPTESAATHIAIQMTKGNDRNAILSNNSSWEASVDSGRNIVFPLSARMITPAGSVRAGQVSGSVMVNFTYQ